MQHNLQHQESQESVSKLPQIATKTHYERLDLHNRRQKEECRCLTFNKSQSILVATCDFSIKIFSFDKGRLQKVQLIRAHNHYINGLYINQKNEIFSSSSDCSIKIWGKQNECKLWNYIEQIQGQGGSILKMILNQGENILITANQDNTIKFFILEKLIWICKQSLAANKDYIYTLSLNESEDQLLSFGEDQQILIFSYHNRSLWILIQTIKLQTTGQRASFIYDNLFAMQLKWQGTLEIYAKENIQEFRKIKEVQVRGECGCCDCFPQLFIKQHSFLINKFNYFINVVMLQGKEFLLQQAIQFNTFNISGTATDDGSYLATWDSTSQLYQIWELQ